MCNIQLHCFSEMLHWKSYAQYLLQTSVSFCICLRETKGGGKNSSLIKLIICYQISRWWEILLWVLNFLRASVSLYKQMFPLIILFFPFLLSPFPSSSFQYLLNPTICYSQSTTTNSSVCIEQLQAVWQPPHNTNTKDLIIVLRLGISAILFQAFCFCYILLSFFCLFYIKCCCFW